MSTDASAESIAPAPLAYENPAFLNSPDGRIIRILSEYAEPLARFRRERIRDTVVFFGSARFRPASRADHPIAQGQTMELLERSYGNEPASADEQKLHGPDSSVKMARYYEDARRLAFLLTQWTLTLKRRQHRFVVTSGGGPGIMEAANRGAREAGGKTIGLNIKLPFEQAPNPYITPALNFEFHYFFMRKYWFAYLAKALVVFPGGFGTLDEAFEILTLAQTEKLAKKITIVMYGSPYWKSLLDFDYLVAKGAIAPRDLELFQFADTPEQAFELLQRGLVANHLEPERQRASTRGEALEPEVETELYPDIAGTR
jgi:uncharacterized protein (TIGR00730 family)